MWETASTPQINMNDVKEINKYLERTYGRALDNKPRFRLVWSEDLYEVRKGLFGDSAIPEVRKARKYTYVVDKWILEIYTRAFPNAFGKSLEHSKDIIMEGDGYEPVRVFRTKSNKPLDPDLEICKVICDTVVELMNRPEARRLTDRIASHDDVEKMKREVKKFEDILNMSDSDILQKFKDREAVILPGRELN